MPAPLTDEVKQDSGLHRGVPEPTHKHQHISSACEPSRPHTDAPSPVEPERLLETARHYIRTLTFNDHQIGSFNWFADHTAGAILEGFDPITCTDVITNICTDIPLDTEDPPRPDALTIRVATRDAHIVPSTQEPSECLSRQIDYVCTLLATIKIEIRLRNEVVWQVDYPDFCLGWIPAMVLSRQCKVGVELRQLEEQWMSELKLCTTPAASLDEQVRKRWRKARHELMARHRLDMSDIGGYFIARGAEKVVVVQERLTNSSIYVFPPDEKETIGVVRYDKPIIAECFDLQTRVLTNKGFLFLHELKPVWETILIANYDPDTKQIKYLPPEGELVELESEPRTMVELENHNHRMNNHLSMFVTDNHDLYCLQGMIRTRDPHMVFWQSHYVNGARMDKPCSKVQAKNVVSANPRAALRFITAAENGSVPVDTAELPFIGALGFETIDQINGFLELYGFWIGDGTLSGGMVQFYQVKEEDQRWLHQVLGRIGIEYDEKLEREGQCLVIKVSDQRWSRLFSEEYGSKYVHPGLLHGVTYDADVNAGVAVKANKWFWPWVFTHLSKDQARLVIEGYRRADGRWANDPDSSALYTSSVRLRDEVMVLLLHAGYSPMFTLGYKAGTLRGYTRLGGGRATVIPQRAYELLTAEEKVRYSEIRATVDAWVISYIGRKPNGFSRKPLVHCNLHSARDVRVVENYTEPVWCLTVPTGLVITQRAWADKDTGIVTKVSRPVVIGQCRSHSTKLFKQEMFSLTWSAVPNRPVQVVRAVLPKFKSDFPVIILLRALLPLETTSTDDELPAFQSADEVARLLMMFCTRPEQARCFHELTTALEHSEREAHGHNTTRHCLFYIGQRCKLPEVTGDEETVRSASIQQTILKELFPHLSDSPLLSRYSPVPTKLHFMLFMLYRLLSVVLKWEPFDDRDHYGNKRMDCTGTLLKLMYRHIMIRQTREIQKLVVTSCKGITQKKARSGRGGGVHPTNAPAPNGPNGTNTQQTFAQLMAALQHQLSRASFEKWWTPQDARGKYVMGIQKEFSVALMTGNWNKNAYASAVASSVVMRSISQYYKRTNFISQIAEQRRVNLPVSKNSTNTRPRHVHPSQFGIICPSQTPVSETDHSSCTLLTLT